MSEQSIKKLKRRFVLIAMISFVAVMLLMGGFIYILNVCLTRAEIRHVLLYIAENDGAVYFKKDYENWKSQKGSNVTMKSYPGLGHDLKTAGGGFDASIAEDIAAWSRGENINKKTAASGGKR